MHENGAVGVRKHDISTRRRLFLACVAEGVSSSTRIYETKLPNVDRVTVETIRQYFGSFGVCVRTVTYHVVQIHSLHSQKVDKSEVDHFLTCREDYPVAFMKGKGYICMVMDANGYDVHVVRGNGCKV